jgi:hypothetical protein
MDLLHGNLQISPLSGSEGDITIFWLTENAKEVIDDFPDEVVVIGGNGGDEQFGVWLPAAHPASPRPIPVLEIGELFGDPPFAIAGTTITRFLRGWSAYYLMLLEADDTSLDALDVPLELRRQPDELDDDAFADVFRWADPAIPDPSIDPYTRGLSGAELRRLFESND